MIHSFFKSFSKTYKNSNLGVFIFDEHAQLIDSNSRSHYFTDKFSLIVAGNFFTQELLLQNIHEVLKSKTNREFHQSETGIHFYFGPIFFEDQIIGVLLETLEIQKNINDNNTPPISLENIDQHFLFLLNNLPAQVWLINPQGIIFWQNETLRKFGNFTANEMMVGDWVKMIHPDDLEIANKGITNGLKSPTTNYSEFRMKNQEGIFHHFKVAVQPIYGNDNNVLFWIGINFDVDNLKNEIKSLKDSQLINAYLSEDYNKDIPNIEKEIFKKQKLETIGNLAGGVAHDFNNILLMISLSNGIIQLNDPENKHQQETSAIISSVRKGAKLASQLMTFSGRNPNLPQVICLKNEFQNIELLIKNSLNDEINLNLVFEDDLFNIYVDQTYLENSLLNIALNARDALKNKTDAEINILAKNYYHKKDSLKPNLQEGEYVSIVISDNGSGISEEIIDKIFDPFFTTKEIGKGTGLGLSMVYKFLEKAKGHVEIKSNLGLGTDVCLFFPKSTLAPEKNSISEENSNHYNNLKPLKILIIEDNPAVRDSLVNILESINYVCYTSFDAYSAYLYLQSGLNVDLIISDVMMPGRLNALGFFTKIREENINTPVLYTSGYAENSIVENGEVLNNHYLLMKPYSLDELLKKINEIL